ncbi:helix-turn-helix domain-containing protein [Halostagnicola sp. A-GB9-2]|uniref:helix-turn-helix domain-containing protein n=1 Tax=Halostagnicola sp. A-GB9-2 TaxID=3048066 RepID=UPI0024BFC088|nr:helix-turn-helix domain-containing protein [Halostagnicola sp. A-GB9-2]MDJ1434711.1 helix-turn-helix domain-containing protein [Halostagnicola sp. A-GB9-2]
MASECELTVYECPSCDTYQLGSTEMNCCEESMNELDDTVPIEPPDEEQLLRTVFDISETELEVCRHLMSEPEVTIEELADAVDRDRSVVARHINHLVELGMVEKRSRVLSEGGRVNIYSHRSADAVRRQFKLGLYTWMVDAVDVIDDISKEKLELVVQGDEPETDQSPVIVDRDEST